MKGAQHAVVAADQDERLAEKLDRTHVAGRGQRRLEADRDPAAVEDACHLQLEEVFGEVKALAGRVVARSIGARMDFSSSGVSSTDIGDSLVRTSGTRTAGSQLHETERDSRARPTN